MAVYIRKTRDRECGISIPWYVCSFSFNFVFQFFFSFQSRGNELQRCVVLLVPQASRFVSAMLYVNVYIPMYIYIFWSKTNGAECGGGGPVQQLHGIAHRNVYLFGNDRTRNAREQIIREKCCGSPGSSTQNGYFPAIYFREKKHSRFAVVSAAPEIDLCTGDRFDTNKKK